MLKRILCPATAALIFLCVSFPAHADFLDARMFASANYQQTSGGAVFLNYYLEIDAIAQSPDGYNSATVSYPGPASPVSLPQSPSDPTFFNQFFGPYATLADLHNDFPFGSYTISFTNGILVKSATIDYSADHIGPEVPQLTSSSLAAVLAWNAAQAVTLDFSNFLPDPDLNGTIGTYATIFGPDGVAFSTFVPVGDPPSVVVPAGTLNSGASYELMLSQGGRIGGGPNAMGVVTEFGFNNNTTIDFTTAAAEPSSFAISGIAMAGLLLMTRRIRSTAD